MALKRALNLRGGCSIEIFEADTTMRVLSRHSRCPNVYSGAVFDSVLGER
jgi:hypothetical protein